MPWLVTFEDEPSRVSLRTTHVDQHVAYVRSVAPTLLASGSLRDTADGRQTGAMWLFMTDDRAEAEKLFQGDPFYQGGLRTKIRWQHWTKGVWDGAMA